MRWLVLTTMVLFAATCGQKGPLERPTPTSMLSPSASLAQAPNSRCFAVALPCPTHLQLISNLGTELKDG